MANLHVDSGPEPLIDPEVRAIVFNLVSALGGVDFANENDYVLGDDALAVLKDIKRWLRLYDDKTNRLDVAHVLAEANLVKGDLVPILASWPESAREGSFRDKVALLCVDLLTQLTWPLQKDESATTLDHFLHTPFLQSAQASYKEAILHHDASNILRAVVRVALPAMAREQKERNPVEETIIKVVLYLIRNISLISRPSKARREDDVDISRSATIEAFQHQGIFDLVLTIGSSLTENFLEHDVELLDIVFNLVKGVDIDGLFASREQTRTSNNKDLNDLLAKERSMHAEYRRNAPSRHNRFGSMFWIKREDGKHSTIFGQKSLVSDQASMQAMDKSKVWRKPRRPVRRSGGDTQDETQMGQNLTQRAQHLLRNFVQDLLDSSFNPLFAAVRRTIEIEADRVLEYHRRQYFYLIAWFLRAERARRARALAHANEHTQNLATRDNFTIVASVLNQETFVLLNRSMQSAQDHRNWQDLTACMQCFTQILCTVQEMSDSALEEDQEIAENTMNRIFYEQTTQDRIINLLRNAKDQSFEYLDACTELSHVFLRLLERYSKQNVDMQVRSLRRARRRKPQSDKSNENNHAEDRELEIQDIANAQKISSERKFDFSRYSAKLVNQSTVDTFVAFLRHYRELSDGQLKRAHRFFHRVAFKMDMTVYLLRLDILSVFHQMVKGPDGLITDKTSFSEWEELTRQVMRRCLKKLEARPCLALELLFSKIPSSVFFLEHGYEKIIPKKAYRPPLELEIKPGMNKDDQIGVGVSILINQKKFDLLAWLKIALSSAIQERTTWEAGSGSQNAHESDINGDAVPQSAISTVSEAPRSSEATDGQDHDTPPQSAPLIILQPSGDDIRQAMRFDKYFRLLMTVIGLSCTEQESAHDVPQFATWAVPSSTLAAELTHFLESIKKFEYAPPEYPDGQGAEALVRRKAKPLPETGNSQENNSEVEDASDLSDLEPLPRDPSNWHVSDNGVEKGKSQRRRARRRSLDSKTIDEKRALRRLNEQERINKVKSSLYVSKSDDESDEEKDRQFFEAEARMRDETGRGLARAAKLPGAEVIKVANTKRKRPSEASHGSQKRRRSESEGLSTSNSRDSSPNNPLLETNMIDGDNSELDSRRSTGEESHGESEADTDTHTPLSSQRPSSSGHKNDQSDFMAHPELPHTTRKNSEEDHDDTIQNGMENDSDKENALEPIFSSGPRRKTRKVVQSDEED